MHDVEVVTRLFNRFVQANHGLTTFGCDNVGTLLTLNDYLNANHVVVKPDGRDHLIDQFLDAKGWKRHVVLQLSHFMSLMALLPNSDLIATVPDDIAAVLKRHIPIQVIELPFKPPRLQIQQYWHRRVHSDVANRWLRGIFYEVNRRDAGVKLSVA